MEAVTAEALELERMAAVVPGGPDREKRLARLIGVLDLTSLTGREDENGIRALCTRARAPRSGDGPPVAAVCVHVPFVAPAREALRGSPVRVATVAGDFPRGRAPLRVKLGEIRGALDAGAQEVDVVVDRRRIHAEDWPGLHREVTAFREACGTATLKTILGTGEVESLDRVTRASLVCLMGGADFLKTSTGFDSVNATLPAGLAMARAIRAHHEWTGHRRGLKPAGDIRTSDQALGWLELVSRHLGSEWIRADRFRIGASSLLDDLTRSAVREKGPG